MSGPASDPVRRPAAVYGLIEWDGSYQPTIIVGCCFNAVIRDVIAIFTALAATGGAVGSPEFQQHHPLPDPHAPGEILADWLDALREDTYEPYVTLMDATELVHTGDNLLVVHRYAANPYVSRTITQQPAAGAHLPGYPPTAAAALPTIVNADPVVAARYVTSTVGHAGGLWHGKHSGYGPHHGLSCAQVQQSLLRRLDLLTPPQPPLVNPDVYLRADDDGDWLTCPACDKPITMLTGGDRLGSLLAQVNAHRCDPATTA